MDINISNELSTLRQMTVPQLREKYFDLYGDATCAHHKGFLIKRIIWRMQALAQGDLSERARRRGAELPNDADLRLGPPPTKPLVDEPETHTENPSDNSRLPMPGTPLTREYRGETVEVIVKPNGFQYDGELYRSLSAVAKAVTGTHWNGYHFFGISKQEKPK